MNVKAVVGAILLFFVWIGQIYGAPRTFYSNSFETPESINDLAIYGDEFAGYSPLHEVRVDSGQLVIETDYIRPNGPGTNPVLTGSALIMMNSDESGEIGVYKSVLMENPDIVSWSINLSNQDGDLNNSFKFVLFSSEEDANNTSAKGYVFQGGGMVGGRMGLWRFDNGLGGGQDVLIDVVDGLKTIPDKGSFRITYDPDNNEWKLYGEIAQEYVDPTTVSTFLGSAIDSAYTNIKGPYFGVCGRATGVNFFDNLTISVEDSVPPVVESSNPIDGASGVAIGASIAVDFSELMAPSTISEVSFIVNDGADDILGNVSYNERSAIFSPKDLLKHNCVYTVIITTDATDVVGNALESNYTFYFKTEESIGGAGSGGSGGNGGGGAGGGGCFISTVVDNLK